ncbi:MAG: hypothetical protein NTX44_00790 [Ignavibacteriales bacterium]|nr:hypothetical protein [Ignavibacteriales bacterium]
MIHTQNTIFPRIAGTLASLLTASVLFTLPAAPQHSKAAAEYLIVEHSDQLLIYNKYQQRITRQEKEAFVPFVPLRILDSRGVLNDNYTPCMKVELNGSIFYLIKNDRTTLIGAGKLGLNQIYGNVTLLHDTVQLITKRSAVLISPDNTQRVDLRNGEKLIRYFQKGDQTYIRPLVASLRFGWARLDGTVRALPPQGKERDNNKNTGVPDKTLERIEMKFREVNTLLANIFMYFNKQSNPKKSIPQWHSIESERSVAYVLEPALYGSYFSESDRYLIRDLDNILVGTVYSMSYTPGKIEIRQK